MTAGGWTGSGTEVVPTLMSCSGEVVAFQVEASCKVLRLGCWPTRNLGANLHLQTLWCASSVS